MMLCALYPGIFELPLSLYFISRSVHVRQFLKEIFLFEQQFEEEKSLI